MAISTRSNGFLSRLKALFTFQRFSHTLVGEELQARIYSDMSGHVDTSKWRKVNSRMFGIDRQMIPASPWVVLSILRNEGFEAYLVGGCVRDLILHKIPKDYDVITTASLKQIMNLFHRSRIVGRRFPICMVHVKGSVVEVSSFETVAWHAEGKEEVDLIEPSNCGSKDFIRWRNSLRRDFTINSLFLDPFVNKIYDYANGMMDLKSLKLRTLIPAQLSFKEDCARILRGLRIAARLGLSLSKDTEAAICASSSSIMSLDKARIMMELNYMLSYGAAERSLHLLQRFKLLELLLPCHAAHLAQQSNKQTARCSVMLMKLFSSFDKLFTCDRPSDCSLWVGLLAFHLALVNNPQDALVVWTFSSVLYYGNWKEGVNFAREHAQAHVCYVPEVLDACLSKSDKELAQEVAQLASLVEDSVDILTETESLSESMSRYSYKPCSGLVFISKNTGKDVADLFHVLVNDTEFYDNGRESMDIDYDLLRKGVRNETRHVLGQIIMDTMRNGVGQGRRSTIEIQKSQQKRVENSFHFDQSNPGRKVIQVKEPTEPMPKQEMVSKRPGAAGNKDFQVVGAQKQEVTDNGEYREMLGENELEAKYPNTEQMVGKNDVCEKRAKKHKVVAEKRKWCTEQDAVTASERVVESCLPQEKEIYPKVAEKGKLCIEQDAATEKKKAIEKRHLPREKKIYLENESEKKRGSPSLEGAMGKNEKRKTDRASDSVRPSLSSLFR